MPSLRDFRRKSWQSTKEFCHTERSEVSQSIYSSLLAMILFPSLRAVWIL
ncbi:hypothetical protein [Helicobacter sp. T3_23-1056]